MTPAATSPTRKAIAAWALWDFGSAAFNAVIVTFVFAVYLTDAVGADLDGPLSATTWLSIAMALAGGVIAFTAPITGQRADAAGGRRRSVGIWTAATVAVMVAMVAVRDEPHYFVLGLLLLAVGSITFQFAEVSYSAMIRSVSTPHTIGRISGLGWAAGYVGGIFLLLALYVGFIAGDGNTRGLLGLTTDGGLNIRITTVVAACWFAVFAIPVLIAVREERPPTTTPRAGITESYRRLFRDIRDLWLADRNTIWFLAASAVFRDGVAGVFAFGAILAVGVYGIGEDQVLLFGVAANLVAAAGSVLAGWCDDRWGPKIVILTSIAGMLAAMGVLFASSGPAVFWGFGLALTAFVGPVQSASRTFLARVTPAGREGQMFGLYATTGRAVSFLAPAAFALAAGLTASDRAGILGIAAVLAVGGAILLRVPNPTDVTNGPPSNRP